MLPAGLEDVGLRLSPNIVGGVGLLAGTYIGARGIGGAVLDKLRDRRERAALAAAGLLGPTVELRQGREPTVIDTTPAGRRPRTRTVGAGAAANGELVDAPAGGLASALSTGGGLTLPPRPVSQLDGRR
jgi:hypothetical protein